MLYRLADCFNCQYLGVGSFIVIRGEFMAIRRDLTDEERHDLRKSFEEIDSLDKAIEIKRQEIANLKKQLAEAEDKQ